MNFRWIRACLLLSTALLALAANAQDLSKLFARKQLSEGCVIWLLKTQVPTEILSYEGACSNKTAIGDWLFGAHQPNERMPRQVVDGTVYLGRVVNGAVDSGLWMTFFGDYGGVTVYDSEKLAGGAQSTSFSKLFNRRDNGFSKRELEALIDKASAISHDKRLPTPSRDTLLKVASQWYEAPQQFTDRWLKPMPGSSTLIDDPKVFGHSARGG